MASEVPYNCGMQITAAAAVPVQAPSAISLTPGFRLSVEFISGEIVIRIAQGTDSASQAQGTGPAIQPTTPATGPDRLAPLTEVATEPLTGREVAERVAADRGGDASLKFEDWDAILPRQVVRRKLKQALKDRVLPFKTKGNGRDGRAKMISARAMVDFLASQERGDS